MLPQITLLMHIMKGYANVLDETESATTLPALKLLDSTMPDCSSDGGIQGGSPYSL